MAEKINLYHNQHHRQKHHSQKGQAPKASIVITTYNWPIALRAVLNALNMQTCQDFEILIADDGSKEETAQLIQQIKAHYSVPIHHIWQDDQGFRAAMIRNKAIAAARGDYIIFLDGDCIPCPNFVAAHLRESEPGYFVAGNRILLTQEFTVKVLSEDIPIHGISILGWLKARLRGHCNKVLPLLIAAINIASNALSGFRKLRPTRWQGAKTCNLAVWRADLLRVNGFEEKFVGWGYEDSDLVIRLINANVKRKGGRFAVPVIHLGIQNMIEAKNHKIGNCYRSVEDRKVLCLKKDWINTI